MKTLRTLILVPVLALTQCTTTQDGKKAFDPTKAQTVINIVVPHSVAFGVSKEPAARKYLLMVAVAIDTFATGTELAPGELESVLNAADLDLLKTKEARAVVDTVIALYTAYYLDVVEAKLDKHNLVDVLKTLSAAIRKGLK